MGAARGAGGVGARFDDHGLDPAVAGADAFEGDGEFHVDLADLEADGLARAAGGARDEAVADGFDGVGQVDGVERCVRQIRHGAPLVSGPHDRGGNVTRATNSWKGAGSKGRGSGGEVVAVTGPWSRWNSPDRVAR